MAVCVFLVAQNLVLHLTWGSVQTPETRSEGLPRTELPPISFTRACAFLEDDI